MKKSYSKFVFVKLLVAFFIGWYVLQSAFNIPVYKLPKIQNIFLLLIQNYKEILRDFTITLIETGVGFFISVLLGVIIAINFSLYKFVEHTMLPIIIALQSVPVVAFAPILFVWLGFSYITKIALAVLISIFPIIINVYKGLSFVPEEDLEFFKSINASKIDVFYHLRIPNAVPYFINSLKISAPLASVGAIVSEFTGAKSGLGFKIIISQYRSDIPALFLYTLLASLLGIILYEVACIPEKFLKKYYYEYEEI